MQKFFHLHDKDSEELLGSIEVTNHPKKWDCSKEITHSWTTFNQEWLNEDQSTNDDHDSEDIDEYVEWHNKHNICQIEQISFEFIQP
jgi:hypothetical protein